MVLVKSRSFFDEAKQTTLTLFWSLRIEILTLIIISVHDLERGKNSHLYQFKRNFSSLILLNDRVAGMCRSSPFLLML